jgi:hypothetical protein
MAEEINLEEEIEQGMKQKSEEFVKDGSKIYR